MFVLTSLACCPADQKEVSVGMNAGLAAFGMCAELEADVCEVWWSVRYLVVDQGAPGK